MLRSFPVGQRVRHVEGPPWLGSCSVSWHIRHLRGALGGVFPCRSAGQAFDGPASLLFSCQCHRLGGERLGSPPAQPLHLSLCSHNSPRPGIAAQPLNSSSQPCAFQEICVPLRGVYGCGKDCLILIPFRLPRISSFTVSLSVSPLTQTIALMWGSDLCFGSPTSWGQVQSYQHPWFPP